MVWAAVVAGWAVYLAQGQSEHPSKATTAAQVTPVAPVSFPAALSPAESLAALRVAPGFRVELVAAEPLVEAPVAIAFDPQGRLWAVEMRDYMPDAGNRSGAADVPRGRVVMLEDTDGDRHMDRRTVVLDDLTLPRAIAFARGGALVAEPPNLWWCPLPDADGKTGKKILLLPNYAPSGGQPEYLPNGLLRALDNWTYSAQSKLRYRLDRPGQPTADPTVSRGQWGITQDDWGHLFYNYNGEHLRGDLVPAEYFARNPDLRDPAGINVKISKDQTVYPIRPNTGVNRGYQPGILRPDKTLRASTATCGPTIYRGELFPPEFRGNAFLCEPAGNLVRRDVLTATPDGWTVRNPYGQAEFLASTEERFRPVNLCTGPEGALYVVDMHRGIIQHTAYVTPYLRGEIAARGLDQPLNQGRIYRVVPDGAKIGPLPALPMNPAALVAELSHPNGWRRDTAQRLLVESGDARVVPALQTLATRGQAPLGRLHALWTLEGLGRLDAATASQALDDPEPKLRAAGLRLSEQFLRQDAALAQKVANLLRDEDPVVCLQLALTAGQLPEGLGGALLAAILLRGADQPVLRDAAMSGLRGRELEFLAACWADPAWASNAPGRAALFGDVAQCVFQARDPVRMERLLELAAAQTGSAAWRGTAALDGLAELAGGQKTKKTPPAPLRLPAAPAAWSQLAAAGIGGGRVRERLARIETLLDWPGKASLVAAAAGPVTVDHPVVPPAQEARFQRGKTAFLQTCGVCHQPEGQGMEGLAPPLVGSPWIAGPEGRGIRIALHGVEGDLPVNGRTYQMEMPPMGALGDEQIAEILTYLRLRWGGPTAKPVETAAVAKVRAETAGREGSWTTPELLKVP